MSKKPVTLLEGNFEKKVNVPVQTVIDLTNPAAVRLNLSCGNCGEMPDRIGAKFCIKCGSELNWDNIFVKTADDEPKSDSPAPQEDTVEDTNAPVHKA